MGEGGRKCARGSLGNGVRRAPAQCRLPVPRPLSRSQEGELGRRGGGGEARPGRAGCGGSGDLPEALAGRVSSSARLCGVRLAARGLGKAVSGLAGAGFAGHP